MASIKVTFTLDGDTVKRIETAAERLSMPKSQIIREAVHEYYERIGRLSEQERLRMLRTFDRLLPKIPLRPRQEAERELKDLRELRRAGGRRTPSERL